MTVKPTISIQTLTTSEDLGKNSCTVSLCATTTSPAPTLSELDPAALDIHHLDPDETSPSYIPRVRPVTAASSDTLNPRASAYLPRRRPVTAAASSVLDPRAPDYIPRRRTVPAETLPLPSTTPRDELDDLIDEAARQFRSSTNWSSFFHQRRDAQSDWGPVESIQHSAKHLLSHYKKRGVPVKLHTKPWNTGRLQGALARGSHKSASEHIPFLRGEYCDMIKKGHWVLLPADMLMDHPELRLSPLGVVPQLDRRPRTIADYSYFGVNDDTVPLAPPEAMQFGRTLPRLLTKIHNANPRFGPVYLSTVDIADGFYRLNLRAQDALRLGVIFPTRPGE